MRFGRAVAALAAALSVGGCASIVEGTTQSVAVTTPPIDGAKCVLTSSEGTYYVTTPGNAIVHKTKHDLTVVCSKEGYNEARATIASHFNGATFGNVIAGGLIGAGVDAATGANYNFPDQVVVPMTPATAASTAPSAVTMPKPTS